MGSSSAATAAGKRRSTGRKPAKRRPQPASKRPRARTPPPKRGRRSGRPAARRRAKVSPPRLGLTAALKSLSWRTWLTVVVLVVVAVAAGYFLWFRDSSLVAIDDVEVAGVRTSDREQIVAELTREAEGMSSLHLDTERLEAIAARFPTIASIEADPNFPHGLRIEVTERPPASILADPAGEVAIAADGTVLAGVPVPEGLPVVEVDRLRVEGRLEGEPLEQALIAGAAPAELAGLIEAVDHSEELGVEVELRGGIPVRFGTATRVAEKWAAAAAVLADPKLDAVTYVDVRVPERAAAGTT